MLKSIAKKKFGRLKLLILLLISSLLAWQLYKQPVSWEFMLVKLREIPSEQLFYTLCFLLILMIFNWFTEAYKWYISVKKFENITFSDALKSVLMGLSLGAFSPFMSGDFLARTMVLKNKTIGLIANGFCSGMQTLTSLGFGFCALVYMAFSPYFKDNRILLIVFILLIGLVLLFAIFIIYLPTRFTRFIPKRLKNESLIFLSTAYLVKILFLSILRNLIYSFQYMLCLILFSISINFAALFWGTQFTFLFKTIGGGLNILGDLIIRQYSAIEYFKKFGIATESILLSTFLLWSINIMLPMIFGLFYISKFKKDEWK